MTHSPAIRLIGIGLYTVPEAARLTGVPEASIRRWLGGYRYARQGGPRAVPPLWQGDLPRCGGTIGLSFLDLMEVRLVHAFRSQQVSWQAIREAATRACTLFKSGHPFATRRFRTDGRRIFADIQEAGRISTVDLNRSHYVLRGTLERALYNDVEFQHGQITRWFPKAGKGRVVLDPRRAFGRPILARDGIPTDILAKAAQVEGSAEAAAAWYGVPAAAVHTALDFERGLGA